MDKKNINLAPDSLCNNGSEKYSAELHRFLDILTGQLDQRSPYNKARC